MLTEKQISERGSYLGASDVASILGWSPFCSEYELWEKKMGKAEDTHEATERMAWGNRMEPLILAWYANETGYRVDELPELTHHRMPFLKGHVDGVAEFTQDGEAIDRRIVEAKNVDRFAAKAWEGNGGVPDYYLCQGLAYLSMVPDAVQVDYPTCIGGNEYRCYSVLKDPEAISMLEEEIYTWWQRHIVEGNEPDPKTAKECAKRWAKVNEGSTMEATSVMMNALHGLKTVKDDMGFCDEFKDKHRFVVMNGLKDTEAATDPDTGHVVVTYKNTKNPSPKFDVNAFKAVHPQIYREFLTPGKPSKRFLPKYEKL